MTSVTKWMIETVNEMPDSFTEKSHAIDFLNDDYSISDRTLQLGRNLLREIAIGCHCQQTWESLINKHLVACEKAYQSLLPEHRDHVLHSAHIYLLGLCIYWKLIRKDPILSACIADTHYLDAQAFYSPASRLYSCHSRMIIPSNHKNEQQQHDDICNKQDYRRRYFEELLPCDCDDDVAGDMCDVQAMANEIMRNYGKCCGPSHKYVPALKQIAEAITKIKSIRAPFCDYIPDSLKELDYIFRRRWGLAAIMHDAAYPLELAAKQMSSYWKEATSMQTTRMACCENPFSFSLNHCCDLMTAPRLEAICSSDIDCNMYTDSIVTMLAANIANKLHPDFSPATLAEIMLGWLRSSLISGKIDHGVFSASLFLKGINAELRNSNIKDCGIVTATHNASPLEYFYIECVDAATAIYLHNTKRYLKLFEGSKLEYAQHPIAWMLFLCDQLQEWLRPSGANHDPGELLKQAGKYKFTIADGTIFYDFPDNVKPETIKDDIVKHLTLLGGNVVKRAS